MTSTSEQSASILPLLALAFWLGATVWEGVEFEKPVYCHTVTGYEYVGRSVDGRPQFKYPEREMCYE